MSNKQEMREAFNNEYTPEYPKSYLTPEPWVDDFLTPQKRGFIKGYQAATLAAEARIRDVLHKLSIASDDYVVCGGSAKYAEGMDYVIKQVAAALTEHKENQG